MIDGIEALLALERTGTISESAAQLRLTQSAVSKRIQALESELGYKLIEPDGRRVQLTQRGQTFLNRARHLVFELKNLKDLAPEADTKQFSIALSDSIAASWGPSLIQKTLRKVKSIELEIHVHRSTLVEENVRLGRYHMGLCISTATDSQIHSTQILEEPMVLISNPALSLNRNTLLTIEKNSGSWKAIADRLSRHQKLKSYELKHTESFAAIIQMVRSGYGHGLVPLGIARAMNYEKKGILILSPSISRPIKLISRKSLANSTAIIDFRNELIELSSTLD